MVKKAAYGLLAAFFALGVYGDIPTTAEGWYEPEGGYKTNNAKGTIGCIDHESGTYVELDVLVDSDGNIKAADGGSLPLPDDLPDIYNVIYEAVRNTLKTETIARQNKERIKEIGKNLHDLTSKTGIEIENTNTKQKFTIKFGGSIASAVSGSTGDIHATSDAADPVDGSSLGWRSDGKLQVSAWDTVPSAGDTLANKLTNGTGYVNDPARSLALVTRTSVGSLRYLAIGVLPSMVTVDGESIETNGQNVVSLAGYEFAGADMVPFKGADGLEWRELADGVPADGKSITTNTTDGAITSGEASLRGFASQSEWAIPYKHGDGAEGELWWRTPDMWCGPSLEWDEDANGNKKFNVAGANDYAGKHAKHYFGTSNDKTATLGWHELPNVTTNRVEGDGITIASTVDDQDPGLKRLGLLGWNKTWSGDPLFVVNAGGSVGYIPLPALTNLAACACSNKWTRTLEWIADGELNGEDGITFTDSTLDQYLYGTLGYVYSTTADNLHFDNDGENVQASFTAPENWADGDSVELADGAYQVAGWADASACDASVSAMLSQPSGSDATTHLFLAKKTDSGELHYVSIGDGIQSGAAVDDTTITTNTAHGAVTSGEASIYGWSGAASDTYLSKNEGGNLEWRKVDPVPGVDDASIVTNTTKELTLKGYAAADVGAVPQKTAQGLSWLKASSATNVILAGAGINITDNGGGAITISAQAYESGGSGDSTRSLTVVTDVRYDETSHKFQKKTVTLTFTGTLGTESGWTDVFTAVSHQSEHEE